MAEIPQLELNTESKIPSIGFGTWQIEDGEEVISSVTAALDSGYRLIDTARIYQNEKGVGEAIRKSSVPRSEMFITTKLWPSDFGMDSARQAFDESLGRLGLEYVDLYLMHWPSRDSKRRHDAWQTLIEIKKEGRAKNIGVSNYTVEHLQDVLRYSDVVPAANQIEFHPYIYEDQKPILEFCKKHGIIVEAYSPLSRGLGLDNLTVNDLAQRLGKTPAQIVLRWAVQHGTLPIPKSVNPEHTRENIRVFNFEISDQDMKMIDSLSSNASFL